MLHIAVKFVRRRFTSLSQKKFVNTLMSRIPVGALCVYKLYNSKCPQDRPANAFYLSPLAKPKGDVWYSKSPLGHNTLGKIVPDLVRQAGFEGYYTNHSLRVSLATRLDDVKEDEQLIMSRTEHSSTDGVQAYKWTSDKLKQLTLDVLTKAPNLPEAHTELEPSCNKHVCLEPTKKIVFSNPFFNIWRITHH